MSRLYFEAASVLGPSIQQQFAGGKRQNQSTKATSLKSRTYSPSITNKKMTHLLVCETLKHKKVLDLVLSKCNLILDKISTNHALVYILLYELLFSQSRKIRGGGGLKRILVENHPKMLKALEIIQRTQPELIPSPSDEHKIGLSIPRYCRVNTLKADLKQVLGDLEAFQPQHLDEHVENLICLPAATDLHDHPLVQDGKLILQDKSSCFPVEALRIEMIKRKLTDYDAIDCCAAPGNKTTQLAAILQRSNTKLYAFDKSPARCELLKTRVLQAGADSIVVTCNDDFLKQDSETQQFQRVRTIMLDPSCSGSGSYSIERLSEERLEESDARVHRLAQFQLEALSHALEFKQAELVSYSTCSILYPENEDVVTKALEKFREEWELVEALPSWPRRGIPRKDGLTDVQAKLVLRADYNLGDKTGGFFLALFARKKVSNTLPTAAEKLVSKRRKRPSSILTLDRAVRFKKLLRMIYG